MQIVHNSYNEAKCNTSHGSDDSTINKLLGEVLRFSRRTGEVAARSCFIAGGVEGCLISYGAQASQPDRGPDSAWGGGGWLRAWLPTIAPRFGLLRLPQLLNLSFLKVKLFFPARSFYGLLMGPSSITVSHPTFSHWYRLSLQPPVPQEVTEQRTFFGSPLINFIKRPQLLYLG